MGFARESRVTPEDVERTYRTLARFRHPDAGGSQEGMIALNQAREAALREVARCQD